VKSFIIEADRYQGHVQKGHQKYLCCCVPPDPLVPAPSNSSPVKTPEITEEDSYDPEPAAEGAFQMEYSSD
jgi:hypothetical protein